MDVVQSFMVMFMFISVFVLQNVDGNIAHYDDYWKKKQEESKKRAAKAAHPNPHEAAKEVNKKIQRHLVMRMKSKSKSSRRELAGGCTAVNPIDKCWRCKANWAENRQQLADCAIGFGAKTTGGKGGKIYTVTDPTDPDVVEPKPGTLRYGCIQLEPLWIVFKGPMTIKLSQELIVQSNKTIDGRGFPITITGGAGFMMQFVHNIIIHNINLHDIKSESGGIVRDSATHKGQRGKSDGDAVSIFGSQHIWVDHLSLANAADGLVDMIEGSTAITVSNNLLTDHNDVMLLGAQDNNQNDTKMQVTVAFNHFGEKCVQRMPRVRMGFAHVVNNDYTRWLMYAIGGSSHPTILSHGNRFTASDNRATKEVTKREYAPPNVWKSWNWQSQDDLFINGAFFTPSGDKSASTPSDSYPGAAGSQVATLTANAGVLNCVVGQPC